MNTQHAHDDALHHLRVATASLRSAYFGSPGGGREYTDTLNEVIRLLDRKRSTHLAERAERARLQRVAERDGGSHA